MNLSTFEIRSKVSDIASKAFDNPTPEEIISLVKLVIVEIDRYDRHKDEVKEKAFNLANAF